MHFSFRPTRRSAPVTKVLYTAILVLIGPALLLNFSALPFLNAHHCDPWYVYGLFFNLPEQVLWRPWSRQISRFTEVVPGYILEHTFSPITAQYGWFLLYFTLAVYFLYRAAHLLISREKAALTALFFALSPIVIGNYATTFSGPGITYEILMLYCAARALRSADARRQSGWMILSGVAWGAALDAHLAVLVFSGFVWVLFALCIFLNGNRTIKYRLVTIASGAAWVIVGLLFFTIAIGTFASVAFKAPYSIVFTQIGYVPFALANDAASFWLSDWYKNGPELGIYILGIAAALICVATHWRSFMQSHPSTESERYSLAIATAFIVTFGVLLMDVFNRGVFLQYEYYYVFLWPFLSLTIFAADIDREISAKSIFVILFAIAAFIGVATKQYQLPAWASAHQTAAGVVLGVVASILLLVLRYNPRGLPFAAYLAVLALSTLVARTDRMGAELWAWPDITGPRLSYSRIGDGLKFLTQLFRDRSRFVTPPKVWPAIRDPGDAFVYSRALFWCEFHPFPRIDPELWKIPWLRFEPGDTLVIVARPTHLFDQAKAVLNTLGLEPSKIASKMLADETGPYEILVVSVAKMQTR